MSKMHVVSTHEKYIHCTTNSEARTVWLRRRGRETAAIERLKNDEIDRREEQIGEMDASQMACMDILKKTMVEINKAAKETIDRLGEEAADNFYIEIAERDRANS